MNQVNIPEHQELVIVRGHPGSGKSTFAKTFSDKGYKHFENDSFFVDEKGNYSFDFAFHQKAKDVCVQNVINSIISGDSVVVSNTYTKIKEMDDIIDFVNEMKVPYRIFEMYYNFENVHSVPDSVVDEKKQNFEPHENAIKIGFVK